MQNHKNLLQYITKEIVGEFVAIKCYLGIQV